MPAIDAPAGAGSALAAPPAVGAALTLGVERTSFGAVTGIGAYSGEPNIAAAPDGTLYVTGLGWDWNAQKGGTMVFRRLPGETGFTYLGMPNVGFGGNDEAVAVAPDGTVWISGMYGFGSDAGACASMTKSVDRGASWEPTFESVCILQQGIDRQWIAVDAAGRPWIVLHEVCCSGQHTAYRSDDGGVTFLPVSVTTVSSGFPGNVFIDREGGRIYEATTCTTVSVVGPCVLGALTDAPTPLWAPMLVARYTVAPPGLRHVAGAVDDAGNVYVTWIDRMPGHSRSGPYVAKSTDGGLTWSAPVRVGIPTRLGTMPWVAAGADGNLAVVWFETTTGFGDPNGAPASTEWHVMASVIKDWTGATAPAPQILQLSSAPAKRGAICTTGASCDANRELLDFFEATVGPDGTLHVVWPETGSWTLRVADVDADLR